VGLSGTQDYLRDISATRLFLKKNFDGPEVVKALRFRLETHLEDPTQDPLSNQVWAAYLRLPRHMEEPFSFLDCGCMSGFMYHHLKKYFKDFSYTGVDRWPEALQVGREYAPEVEFIQADFETDQIERKFDYVLMSNIPFKSQRQIDLAVFKMVQNAKKTLFVILPRQDGKPVIHAYTPSGSAFSFKDA
jgi:SAM-dependent methyltransferase